MSTPILHAFNIFMGSTNSKMYNNDLVLANSFSTNCIIKESGRRGGVILEEGL